jgi:hypothetical protein
MGQFDNAEMNEKYFREFYDTLLFNLSAPPRPGNPRYAKVQLDEAEFEFSRAHIDHDFLYQPQQAELFASPAGSWSDVHIGIYIQRTKNIRAQLQLMYNKNRSLFGWSDNACG